MQQGAAQKVSVPFQLYLNVLQQQYLCLLTYCKPYNYQLTITNYQCEATDVHAIFGLILYLLNMS